MVKTLKTTTLRNFPLQNFFISIQMINAQTFSQISCFPFLFPFENNTKKCRITKKNKKKRITYTLQCIELDNQTSFKY